MAFNCPGCNKEFVVARFPYGDDITCPHCNRAYHTDWEEAYDSQFCWITGPVESPQCPMQSPV